MSMIRRALRREGRCVMRLVISAMALLALGACSTVSQVGDGVGGVINSIGTAVTPYKIEIVQGNVLTKEQVAALQKGMAKDQVRAILGSPLVTSAFHGDRWDYVFTIERKGIPAQERRMHLIFKGDELQSFTGDTMPSEVEFVATLVTERQLPKVPELKASEERLRAFAAANAQRSAAPAEASSAPVRTDYPPLEAASAAPR
jgi:outer membrane protein assembly factor BamE